MGRVDSGPNAKATAKPEKSSASEAAPPPPKYFLPQAGQILGPRDPDASTAHVLRGFAQ